MLRSLIARELIRRHGCGAMTGKIKPVHIANGLFREKLGSVGKTANLKLMLVYTAARSSEEKRQAAMESLLEKARDSWGRLADDAMTKEGALGRQVLPMLRTLLGTDGAVFGESIDQSSLTTPTGRLVTGDPSDEHAGALLKALWKVPTPQSESGQSLLDLLESIIDPERDLSTADDLTVLFSPLVEEAKTRDLDAAALECEDIKQFLMQQENYDAVLWELRQAADLLCVYEQAVRPNPIATLERIICLGSLTIFFYMATRGRIWAGLPARPLLLQAIGKFESPIARASAQSVHELVVSDSKRYLIALLKALVEPLGSQPGEWLNLWKRGDLKPQLIDHYNLIPKRKDIQEMNDFDWLVRQADDDIEPGDLLGEIVDKIKEKDSLEDYLRLLGMRSGLLYPQQKNFRKRVYPEDRVIEVLVAGTTDVINEMIEYQEFLDRLWRRFGIVTGGLPEDEYRLTDAGVQRVSSKYLRENSEAFLKRLEEQGLAKRMADSKALVGLMGTSRGSL